MVKIKSGMVLPIFFFSSHHPHSGIRTQLPKGYIVKENPTSHMPYLKKETQNLSKNNTIPKQSINIKKPVIYVVNHSKNPLLYFNIIKPAIMMDDNAPDIIQN